MFGTHQDVSERKREEEVRRKNEGFLDRTGKVAGVGGWEVDLRKGEIIWSDETCRIHGVELGYRPTMDEALEFYPIEVRQALIDALDASMRSGEAWDLELPFKPRGCAPIWVRAIGSVEFENGQAVRIVGAFQNITERRLLALKLAEQHELMRITLQSIGDAVITTDALGNIVWMNPVAERLTSWSTEDAHGQSLREVFHVVNTHTREVIPNPATVCLLEKYVGMPHDTTLISRDGSEYGIQESASPMLSERGEVLGVVIVFHDVTEQRKMTGEMRFRATHDSLTSLINRAEFESRLGRLLQTAHNEQTENALLYIDLDQFKIVNDSCGHAVGDQLLIQVSKMLGESVRARDTLARLGGDEFAILLERCPQAQAQRVAQQICDRMEDFRFMHDGRRFRVGTSIGLVPVDQRWITPEAIMQAADGACYAAKEGGRNRVHTWFDSDASVAARHGEMQWTTRIEQALDDDEFVLHGQRIKALSDGAIGLHAEVLVRMKDADGSLIMPNAFLPAAERFQLASRIDKLVLRRTLDWMLRVGSLQHIENISVNLSGKSVGDRAFHRWAIEQLQGVGIEICQRLSIELTETAAVTNLTDAVTFIKQVRGLGVRVALDDFGSGASSFGYLKTMPVDLLKIDGQFVRDLASDPLDEAAVRSFANVAKVIGVKTVAEYVESAAILDKVTEIGIDFAQGFYLFEPEPLDHMLARYLGELV
jgi:diguanylate cyclase